MERQFKIEGLDYRLFIGRSGDVWFELLGGMTRKGSANRNPCKDLFWDEPNFADVDLGINALKVYNVVKDMLLSFVFTRKPPRIGFCASSERKIKIYRWMARRLAGRLGNYNLVEFPDGVFNFYKQVQLACRDHPRPRRFEASACRAR